MCLWDESFLNVLKTYQLHSSAIEGGGTLYSDLPPIRALVLGQGRILVGTKNSEVCAKINLKPPYYRYTSVSHSKFKVIAKDLAMLCLHVDFGSGQKWPNTSSHTSKIVGTLFYTIIMIPNFTTVHPILACQDLVWQLAACLMNYGYKPNYPSQGHQEGELWGLATHPKQPLAVTASDDGTVRVWSLTEHRMLRVLSVGKPARCVDYSCDGRALAVGFKDGKQDVFIIISHIHCKPVSNSHGCYICLDLGISSDATTLVSRTSHSLVNILFLLCVFTREL